MPQVKRKYPMVRVRAGSYLLPSNDLQMLWHIYRHDTWWACAKFHGSVDEALESVDWDMEDHGQIRDSRWEVRDTYQATRREAINAALSDTAPLPKYDAMFRRLPGHWEANK